jgi:hypothetical protein
MGTYWNGERCEARRCVVIIPKAEKSSYWYAEHEGKEWDAVEIKYGDSVFYIDNANGLGWAKVTHGQGSPSWGHGSLPSDSKVIRYE